MLTDAVNALKINDLNAPAKVISLKIPDLWNNISKYPSAGLESWMIYA